jgi:DNA-binding GntR family transcriptional regulator
MSEGISRRDFEATTFPRVTRLPLSQQVADAIRSMILIGQLAPGEEVTQDQLADLVGVSTMPVREALLRLSHEGLVDAHHNRSFRVTRISKQDVEDVYRTHAFLAGELTARAAARGGDDLVAELDAIQTRWPTADSAGLEELNWSFHRAINKAAQSPKILLFLRNTIRFIPDHFYSLLPEWRAISDRGHRQLVRAIARQDPERARTAAERHVREAGQLLIEHFTESGHWSVPRSLE